MAATSEVAGDEIVRSDIANLTVKTLREYTGRGPTKAKTYLTDDCAVVILQDALLPAERTLVEQGETETVMGIRRKFQQAMRDRLVEGVEAITGRKVAAFLSDSSAEPDISIETFVFEEGPAEEPEPAVVFGLAPGG